MKKAKLISILTTAFVIMLALTTVVSAQEVDIGGVKVKAEVTNGTGNLVTTGNKVIGIIQVVGTLIAVGMVLVLGIKYMMGSAEEKAANKKSMIPYLIGAVLLFLGVNIVKIVFDFANTL